MPGWPPTGPRGLALTAEVAGQERHHVVQNLALAQIRALIDNITMHDDRRTTLLALDWAVSETQRSETMSDKTEDGSNAEQQQLRSLLERMQAAKY